MAGGGHHEPPVFTHFLPGMVAGIVLGGITGALFVAHLASSSLQFFWEASHVERYSQVEGDDVCSDASGVRLESVSSETGGALTSITIGEGEEALLTVPAENLRFVSISNDQYAYLTAVASPDQHEAFPATSLYRVDYCEQKMLVHVLGSTEEPVDMLGMSESGTWVLFEDDGLRLMNTKEHYVIAFATGGQVREVVFSQADDGGAMRFADGSGVVWSFSENGYAVVEESFVGVTALPAWTLQSPQEYLANIK